jgi:prephenate dehydratase
MTICQGTRPTSVQFSINDKVGGLEEYLKIVHKHNINMTRIESRPSKNTKYDYEFFLDFETHADNEQEVEKMLQVIITLSIILFVFVIFIKITHSISCHTSLVDTNARQSPESL